MSKSVKTVCFVGLGYIGLPTAIVAANSGFTVRGYDIDGALVEQLNLARLPFNEPGLEELCRVALENESFRAYTEPVQSDSYFIVVPTPFNVQHEPDISYVVAATKKLVPLLKAGDLFVIESTSPVGTTEKIAKLLYQERPELAGKLHVAYCPERVMPGRIVEELVHNDRIVGGIDEASTTLAAEFYAGFVKGAIHKTHCRTAELCKLTENASRDVQIAFANELSMICEKADIDVWELIKLANKHPRVSILQPGCGVGGHCIAVDPYFLTSDFPVESQIIAKAREINNYKAIWCTEKISKEINDFNLKHHRKPVVALMGLAFKANVSDLRESPAKYIVTRVIQMGNADFLISEPNIKEHGIFKLTCYNEAYERADIVAFLLAHKEFATLKRADEKQILNFCGLDI